LFIGDETITGSLETSGSVRFRGIPWPETGSEHHLFKTDPYVGQFTSGDRNYSHLGVTLEQVATASYYENSLLIYTYDDHDNPNYGAELNIGPLRSHLQVLASGSGNLGNISLQDVEDGTTRGLIYADDIQIGVYTGSNVEIGNGATTTTIDGTLVSIKAPISSSTYISASAFYGDGSNLSGVGAASIEYADILNKPTLVSGSSQIDVNNTQNFTAFSTSVDSRLDTIEGDLSTSIDSQLENIHSYTSSLKTAIDVDGSNLIVFGDLTVQGDTTTLNTSNLLVEDKLIELASGSTTSAEADGAGLYISGANAFLTWNHSDNVLETNRKFSASLGFKGDGSEIVNIQHGNIDFGGSSIVSGSSQVTGALDLRYLEIGGESVVSQSHQIDLTQTTNYESGIKQRLDAEGVVSSSIDTSTISFSIQSGIISASAIGGIVSQSAQVVLQNADKTGFTGASSITTLGTISTGVWNGTVIDKAYLDDEVLNTSLNSYTASNDISGSDQDARLDNIETTTASLESRLDNTETFTSSYYIDSASVDSRLDYLEGGFSTSVDDRLDLLSDVSHSHANKANLDTIDQDLASTDEPSFAGLSLTSILPQASGSIEFNALFLSSSNEFTYRTLGDAILYSVTSSGDVELTSGSISYGSDNLLTAGAVKKYVDWRTEEILDAVGAADITGVTPIPGGGLFGGGLSGDVSLSLDSGSDGFKNAVYSVYGTGVLSSSNETFAQFSSSVASDFAGLSTDYNDLQNIPAGIISGAAQLLDVATDFGTGRVSGDNFGDVAGTSTFTGSFVGDGTQLSGVTSYTDADTLDYINSINVISGSDQVTSSLDSIYAPSGSVYTPFSTSVDDRLDTLEGASNESPLTFNDTNQVDLIRTGDVITANLKGGVVSGSSQVNFTGLSGISSNIISASSDTAQVDMIINGGSISANLKGGVISGSSQLDGENVNLGGISGSSLDITGNTKIDGNVIVGGNITVGDATSDKITFASNISSSLIPDVSNAFDLGSPTKRWRTLYISGSTIDLGGTLIQRDDISGNITFLDSGSQTALSAVVGYEDITGKPTLVSQSVQIVYGDISSLPTNIVSQSTDSSNVDFTITNGNISANLKGGVVSGSDQVTQSLDSRYLNLSGGDSVSGNTTFENITVNGTGSFAYIQSTTGSAKIIGDAFVVLNTETPTSRYAGLSVYDSGSTLSTASFYFDGQTNDWGYEYSSSNGVDYAVTLFGPEYSTKGNPTYLTSNTIPKAVDNHHLNDSNITDDGTTISLGSNVNVTGSIVVSGTVDGIDLQAFSSSVDGRLDTLEAETHENPLTFNDTAQVDFIRAGDTITANLKGGVISGSAQVTLGGDLSGTANSATVTKVQGVSLTSGEATQLANIDTTTISSTQWGYVGALNQGLTTTSTVQFGKIGVGGASDATYELKVTGDIGATGDIVAYISSDRRLKDEITPIENPLEKINQIGGYSFVWNENQDIYKGKDYGVIAQEIESILPELVENRENGYKAVKYDRIVSLLIEGIKDLHSEVQELKEKLKD